MTIKSHLRKLCIAMSVMALLVCVSGSVPAQLNAASPDTTYTLLEPLPCVDAGNNAGCTVGQQITGAVNFKTYVNNAFSLIIALAAVASVMMIVYGGFQYMTSTIPGVKSDGKEKIQNALTGLLLVLSAYLILRTIDPRLVQIPDTLVPQLSLKCPTNPAILMSSSACKSDTVDFFGQLASQAKLFQVNYEAARASIAKAQAQSDDIDKQKTSIQNQIVTAMYGKSSGDDVAEASEICDSVNQNDFPDIAAMCAQLASKNDTQDTIKKTIVLETAVGKLTGAILQHCSPTGDPALCDIQQVTKIFDDNKNLIPLDQRPQLVSAAAYGLTIMRITGAAATLYQSGILLSPDGTQPLSDPNGDPDVYRQFKQTISDINTYSNIFIKNATNDPSLIDQMKSQQKSLLSVVNGMKYHQ